VEKGNGLERSGIDAGRDEARRRTKMENNGVLSVRTCLKGKME
jgi:hypothetical protein